ncbi:CYTH domain-containing protein [Bacillus tianshenii]|nr:CYTH domain-containing protein [Bacillus tianshenii]
MSQEVEIEFKNLLTKEEFNLLYDRFQLTEEMFWEQANIYFDTPDFTLRDARCALRIRYKNNQYTLTLKEPHGDDLLETHQSLSEAEAAHMLEQGGCIPGDVSSRIEHLGLNPSAISNLGELRTKRTEIKQDDATIVFDHSFYLDTEDYELEMEVTNRKKGEKQFEELLMQYKIPKRDTPNKIRRFFSRKREVGIEKD